MSNTQCSIAQYIISYIKFDLRSTAGVPSTDVTIAVSVSGILLLLFLIILFCIFKQQRAKRRAAANVRRDDRNPTYRDYYDPDPKMEVKDTNAYYSSGLVDFPIKLICNNFGFS